MALIGKAEIVRRAEALGHSDLRVFPTKSGRRFVCQCSCGWGSFAGGQPTVTRATLDEAVKTLQHHLWRAVANDADRRQRDGVSEQAAVRPA